MPTTSQQVNFNDVKYLQTVPLTFQQITEAFAYYLDKQAPLINATTILSNQMPWQGGFIAPIYPRPTVSKTFAKDAPLQFIDPRGVGLVPNKRASVKLGIGTYSQVPALKIIQDYIKPAVGELVNAIELEMATTIQPFIPSLYLSSNPAKLTYADLTSAVQMAEALGASPTDAALLINTLSFPAMYELPQLSLLPTQSQESFRVNGIIANIQGWPVIKQRTFLPHVAGSPANNMGVVIPHALNIEASVTVVFNVVGGGTLNQGDVIHLAGHPIQYKIQSDITADGSGNFTANIFPPLQLNASPSTSVLIYARSGSPSLFLHKRCVGLITEPLPSFDPMFSGGLMATVTSPAGVSIRMRQSYDGTTGTLAMEAEVSWGCKVVNPHLGLFVY